MKIAAGFPLPKDLIENEISTLKEMGGDGTLNEVQGRLAAAAHGRYQCYRNQKSMTKFEFSSWMEFSDSPIAKSAFVECLISVDSKKKPQYDMLTYSFGLLKLDEKEMNHLVKKFHIDFTSASNTGRPPLQPIFHLQSPGTLSPMLKDEGIKDDHLEPGLSEPRLHCGPTTLALIIDFLFREFGGDRTSSLVRLTKKPEWKKLIRKNENLVLKPYYKACSGFFQDRSSKKEPERNQLFSQNFVYGQP